MEKNKQHMLKGIAKIHSLNLRHFVLYFCIREDKIIGVKARSSAYDYKRAKKLIHEAVNYGTEEGTEEAWIE